MKENVQSIIKKGKGMRNYLNKYFKSKQLVNLTHLVSCNTSEENCKSLLSSINYPITNEPALTFVNFEKNSNNNSTFTFNDNLNDKDSIRDYFFALKNDAYLMDSISKKLSQNSFTNIEEINYAALDELFDMDRDFLIFFYPSTCGQLCDQVKETLDSSSSLLSQNNVNHVHVSFFETDQNSTYGLSLDNSNTPIIRFYRAHDLNDYAEMSPEDAIDAESVLSFVIDMSSKHIDVDNFDL